MIGTTIDLDHELFKRADREKEYYKAAVMDLKTGDTWPREASDEETKIARWLKVVLDPGSKRFFKGKDEKITVSEDGIETKTTTDVEPSEAINSIQRERTPAGEEFLLWKGVITGYNQFGEPHPLSYSFLGRFWETTFAWNTQLEDSSGQLRRQCMGPQGGKFHYTRPFSPGNVDKLWSLRDPENCILLVKDILSKDAKQCPDIEMFKTKPFEYILKDQYLSEKEKEEMLLREQVRHGDAQPPTKKK